MNTENKILTEDEVYFANYLANLPKSQTVTILSPDEDIVKKYYKGCFLSPRFKFDYEIGFNQKSSLKLNLKDKTVSIVDKNNAKPFDISKKPFNFLVVDYQDFGYASIFRNEDYRKEDQNDTSFFEPRSLSCLAIIVMNETKDGFHAEYMNDLGDPIVYSLTLTSLATSAFENLYKSITRDANTSGVNVKQRAIFSLTHILQDVKNKKDGKVKKNVDTAKFEVTKFTKLFLGEEVADFKARNIFYNASVISEVLALAEYSGFIPFNPASITVQKVKNIFDNLNLEQKGDILKSANGKRFHNYKKEYLDFVSVFSQTTALQVGEGTNTQKLQTSKPALQIAETSEGENLPF